MPVKVLPIAGQHCAPLAAIVSHDRFFPDRPAPLLAFEGEEADRRHRMTYKELTR